MRESLARLQRVAARWHVVGYATDLLQYLHDITTLRADRRRVADENPSDMVGVKIEYIHGRLASTQTQHSEATADSINRQHANMDDIDRSCTLLDLFLDPKNRMKQTYHLPDTLGCDQLIAQMADVIREAVSKALSASSKFKMKIDATTKKETGEEDEARIVIDGLHRNKIIVQTHMLLDEAIANKQLAENTIVALKKQNSLESVVADSQIVVDTNTTEVVMTTTPLPLLGQVTLSKMLKKDMWRALRERRIQFTSNDTVKALRALLGVSLRSEFLKQLRPDDGELGAVCDMIKRAGDSDFSICANMGVFASIDSESDDDDT